LYVLAISGLAVYGIIIAGWASNSKYAFLGALRAVAQMISYEVSISLIVVQVVLVTGSLNFTEIVLAQENLFNVFLLFPVSIIFFISILAETNRAPFDLAEAEAEIVAGYNLEYSAIIFAMFFLGEYCNMIAMSALMNIFFFGGWLAPLTTGLNIIPLEFIFAIKTVIFAFFFIVVRTMLPRYRYDQLMTIG
jgi:NADH-quinone oxidoreductase subunit H